MIFKDTIRFSYLAEFFRKNKCYTLFHTGTPAWKDFWDDVVFKCKYGYTVKNATEDNQDVTISGPHFFYLNFVQIDCYNEETDRQQKGFPRFTDVDYDYFNIVERARKEKKGIILVKPRRTGFSYKNAALVAWEYNFFVDSKALIGSFLSKFSETTMKMVLENLNFLDTNTVWVKPRNPDTKDFIKARHKVNVNGVEIWKGYMSEVTSMSFKDNPFASVGKRASIFLWEEAGTIENLINSYGITSPCWMNGNDVVGLSIVFGCVCARTKVWTKEGKLINIEDLKQEDGIIGYDGERIKIQNINWFKEPAKKNCYRITTDDNTILECSDDHPLLITKRKLYKYSKGEKIKRSFYQEAKYLNINDQILLPSKVDIFGNKKIEYARELGLLIGDGNYSKGSTPSLSVSEYEIYDYIKSKYNTILSHSYIIDDNREYNQITIKGIKDKLEYHKMYGQVKLNKRLPYDIHTFDKNSVAELLAGYFDSDGNIYYNKKKDIVKVVLTSIVEELLTEVKYQLLKFGIHSMIVKETRNTEPSEEYSGQQPYIYRLYINQQQDLLLFKDNIKLLIKSKSEKLELIKKSKYQLFDTLFEINPLNKKEGYFNNKILKDLRYATIKKIEEIGEQYVYNLNCGPNHNYISNTFITRQTGGDMEGGTRDFGFMFYEPSKFDLLEFENTWDKGKENTKCGWFIPATRGRFGKYKNKLGRHPELIDKPFIDKDGNSDEELALLDIEEERETRRKSTSAQSIKNLITQYPLTPQEAFLRSTGNIFPILELQERLSEIETSSLKSIGQTGELYFNTDNKIKFKLNPDLKPINNYPLKSTDIDRTGALVIWEHPEYDNPDLIPYGMYLGGADPYDLDKSGTGSLGSFFIYKTSIGYRTGKTNRILVAEYTARPEDADSFYETCRRLCIYYNAKCLYENQLKGFKNYFLQKHSLHLLYEQPNNMIKDIVKDSKVNRGYGVHMNRGSNGASGIKDQCEIYVKQWLTEELTDIEGKKLLRLQTILSIPLLQELIAYSKEGNFDRFIALAMCILQDQENYAMYQEEEKKDNKENFDKFFTKKLFTTAKSNQIFF